MTPPAYKKTGSLGIHAFQPDQLDQLADIYDEIRARLGELRALTRARLPPESNKMARLVALRHLDATGKLTIRITAAGKLNVRVLLALKVGRRRVYATVVRRPVTNVRPRKTRLTSTTAEVSDEASRPHPFVTPRTSPRDSWKS